MTQIFRALATIQAPVFHEFEMRSPNAKRSLRRKHSYRDFGFQALEPRYLLAGITLDATTERMAESYTDADVAQILRESISEKNVLDGSRGNVQTRHSDFHGKEDRQSRHESRDALFGSQQHVMLDADIHEKDDDANPAASGATETGQSLPELAGSSAADAAQILPGDANLDGVVDGLDADALAQGFGVGSSWGEGDFNGDASVDGLDADILAQNFGTSLPADDSPDDSFSRPLGLSSRLTVSFAPDGTSIFDQTNSLFSSFSSMLSAQQIQDTILNGFNVWAQNGNLDIGYVADSGAEFGAVGEAFGDSRFGDIRIGAISMASDVFAVALGQGDFVSGTWAGDILFNSNAQFDSAEHFAAVVLHEIGHVLGMGHSNDPSSVMHRFSNQTDLAAVDIAQFQSLYGLRTLDDHDIDEVVNNNSLENATEIKFDDDGHLGGTYPSIAFGDIMDSTDVDFFRLDSPGDYEGMIGFKVVSEGISQLAPRVSLLSKDGDLITQIDSDKIHGDVVSISASALESDGKYFLKIESGPGGSTGSYSLVTILDDRNSIDSDAMMKVAKDREFLQLDQEDIAEYFADPNSFLMNEDSHSDDEIGTAIELETDDGYESSARYHHIASLADNQDIDTYRFKSLKFDEAVPHVMNISVRSVQIGGMVPKANLFDKDGNEMAFEIAVNGRGEFVIQTDLIESEEEYFLSVESDDFLPFNTGNYELTISYSESPVVFQTRASGTVNSGTKQYHSMHVAESQIIQFALEADALPGNPDAMIWVTIYDASGAVVYQNTTRSGERRTSTTALFAPGSYVIEIQNAVDSEFANLNYRLIGIDVGDPQGPVFTDPTETPFNKNENGEYEYPDDVFTGDPVVVVTGISTIQTQPPINVLPRDIFDWYWGFGI